MPQVVRFGLVGTGAWSRHVHGAGIVDDPDTQLVAVWGRDSAKRREVAHALGANAATSYDELLEQVDAVAFAVPPDVQGPLALRAAMAGKHLLLEKPITLDVAMARQLVEVSHAADVATVVFLTWRWIPQMRSWLDEVASVGGWESGSCAFVASLPDDLLTNSPWRARHGGLWDVGPHALSKLERILGRATEVVAVAGVRDTVHLTLRHDGGATSTAQLTLTASAEAAHHDVRFWGRTGRSSSLPPLPDDHSRLAHRQALADLVAQARTGARRRDVDASYGLHLVEVLAAAERSLETAATQVAA